MSNSNNAGHSGWLSFLRIGRTLQVNILIAFTTLLIITVLIVIGYTYQQNSLAVLQLSDDLIDQVTETVIEKTTNYLAPAAVMARASAEIPAVETISLVDNQELESYGMEILNLYPQLAGFFIGNEQGDFLFTKRFPDTSIGTQVIDRAANPAFRTWTYRDLEGHITEVETTVDFTYDPRQRPWYEGAKSSQQQYWTDIYIFFTDQKPGITAAYPVIDDQEGLVSVIGIDVALDELSRFLQTQKVGQNGVAFIINDKAEIVAYPGIPLAAQEGENFRPVNISELEISWVTDAYNEYEKTGHTRFTIESEGERYIASFSPFPVTFGQDWQIGIIVPEDDFVGAIKQTNQISLLISLGTLLVAIISAIFISRTISRPIVLLTEETKKIKDLELDSVLEINSSIREVQLLGESIAAMKTGLKAFKKYVPAELVRQLIQTGEEAELGGRMKELTILFTDIAGFTTISEQIMPEKLMVQLSEYLGNLATIIEHEKGTVDKYVGDGLMAFWGAPSSNPNHAYYACYAALRCRNKVAELNQRWHKAGKPTFPTRMGIHTGNTLVGNMGSVDRMNYTVLGDSVNLASRLESINDIYGTEIIISAATYHKVVDKFHFRPVDIVTVRGKQQGVLLYELVGEIDNTPPEKMDLCRAFTRGFDAYLAQDWDAAVQIFQYLSQKYPADSASQIYLTRCTALQINPPDPDWKPIIHLAPPPVSS
jgi:adenylate cyclase